MTKIIKHITFALFAVLAVADCTTAQTVPFPHANQDYVLGVGDKLMVTVYNQEKLSGEFVVNAKGDIAFPLLGTIAAKGSTTGQLEENITASLQPKYLNDPKVSIQVMNYRSVYVLGEVNTPGKYEYVPDMTLPQAVATAGGYTSRASEDTAEISRHFQKEIRVFDVDNSALIMPEDVVVIKRRWF